MRIILEWILRKKEGSCGLDVSVKGEGQVAGCCEYGNEPSGSIKGRELLN
jgi:hypothetical protein